MKKIIVLLFISSFVFGQNLDYNKLALKYAKTHFSTLKEYLELPCDANYKEDIEKNITWVNKAFIQRGFTSKKLETAGIPVLLFERLSKSKNAKTIMFYFHSDGQPVKKEEWNQEDPYKPELKKLNSATKAWEKIPYESLQGALDPEWRIWARASSDDKGPGVMMLAALDLVADLGKTQNYNLKILVDFEEEKGSPNLPGIIDRYKNDLKSDMLLIFDGPAHASNLPTLTFGARGIATMTLTTYGPIKPVHSGHFGNYIPNPALKMAKLLADMKDDDGKVTIKGFYNGVKLNEATKQKLALVPDDLVELNNRMGIKFPDKVGQNYQESLVYPSLNIRGLKSGEVGGLAATIIPDKAIAEIDIRIVTTSKPEYLIQSVKDYVVSKNYHIVTEDPTLEERLKYENICRINTQPAYSAFSTDMNGELANWLEKALNKTTTNKIVKLPTMGGSVPISPFVTKLGANAIIVPTVNSDNNQHSANENLRIGNFLDGIKTISGILLSDF